MKWLKLGNIFNPLDYTLPSGCVEFAQSPQALVFDDFIRIFFSTRKLDFNGKFLSRVCFADFDKSFTKVLRVSEKPVIELGELGCYDEHGIFPLNVLRDNKRILGFIGGWSRRVAVSVETSIGLAYSYDEGLSFHRNGNGPILTSSSNEPFLVGDPFVLNLDGIYHLWYIYGQRWIQGPDSDVKERVYKIAHAVSNDCIIWEKDNFPLINDILGSDECQALPTVIKIENVYHMVFCYRYATDFRTNKKRGYRLGYAYSKNLQDWIRDDEKIGIDVSFDGWDSEMMCYPHLFGFDNNIYLLYNGNEFGRFGFGIAKLETI
jgi:hypothetical protein